MYPHYNSVGVLWLVDILITNSNEWEWIKIVCSFFCDHDWCIYSQTFSEHRRVNMGRNDNFKYLVDISRPLLVNSVGWSLFCLFLCLVFDALHFFSIDTVNFTQCLAIVSQLARLTSITPWPLPYEIRIIRLHIPEQLYSTDYPL